MTNGMRLSNPTRNFLLLFVSLAAALLAGEFYLRWNPPASVYFETLETVQRTHSEISPYPYIGHVPERGSVKTFRTSEFHTTIKINSMSMRDDEYPVQKPVGVKRIAVMGDSFVFGWGVENKDVFTKLMEKEHLKNTDVLNFGVAGYSSYQAFERLKRDALKFQPDIVLFFLYGFPDGYPDTPVLYEIRDGHLVLADMPPPSFKKRVSRFLSKNIYWVALINEARGTIQVGHPPPQEPSAQKLETEKGLRLLKALKDFGTQNHFIPVVFYIPIKQSVKEGTEPEAELVSRFCLQEGIYFLDLTRPLHDFWKRERKSPYFRIDNHWNLNGHRAVAGIVSQYLKEKGFLDQ